MAATPSFFKILWRPLLLLDRFVLLWVGLNVVIFSFLSRAMVCSWPCSYVFFYVSYIDTLYISFRLYSWFLSQDISTESTCIKQWRLKLSEAKTVLATFHLNNRAAKRELKVDIKGRQLPNGPYPALWGNVVERIALLAWVEESMHQRWERLSTSSIELAYVLAG